MKTICRIILYFGILTALAACSSSQKDNKEETIAKKMSYHEQAINVKINKGAPEKYIALQLKAVEEMRQGKAKETAMEILSQMGYFYFRSGQYMEALTYLQEATDSMFVMPQEKIDIKAGARLLGNTSNIYSMMGLYDEAQKLNSQAIELCRKGNNEPIPDLWRMRGAIYKTSNQLDSGLVCIQNAIKASDDIEDKEFAKLCKMINEKSYAYFFIENPNYNPDSIATAVKLLERIDRTDYSPVSRLVIGRGYVLMGNTDKGIKIMETQLQKIRQSYGTDDIEWALNLYSQSLLERELPPHVLTVYKESRKMSDSIAEAHKKNALLGADFKYRTTQIKNEKQLLESRLEMVHERTIWWSILTLMVGCGAITLTVMRIRHKNKVIENNREAIDNLIKEKINLNSAIEILNERVNEQMCQSGIQNTENVEAYSEILKMVLITKEDEILFRQLFDSVYPSYVQRLRRNYPEISPTAELICMLIRLNKSNKEISLSLGIKRESVTKSRYRLRTLFKLDKDTDLNDFIAKI